VRLTPRGGEERIDGWGRGADGEPVLKVRVRAPPADGEANAALVALIARTLGSPRAEVRIAAGHASRRKLLEIDAEPARLAAVFGAPPG
jgi:uncharacterized protein YggU (UPF0235/DUF167 family)